MTVMPMFPLGSVLLPSMLLPLHVFEPRYRSLITDVLAGDREFGVALIERGFEVGGGDERSQLGCVAQVLDAAEQSDGRWFVLAVGTRRFAVDEWLPDAPYPRAQVQILSEEPAAPGDDDLFRSARSILVTVQALRSELALDAPPLPDDMAEDAALGSYQLAALAPFGSFDRQRLLAAEGPTSRLQLLQELLEETEADLRAELALGREHDG